VIESSVTVIERSRGLPTLGVREAWQRRDLLRFLISRQIKSSYRQMAFGPIWIIMQPLVSMIIVSFVFGRVARLPSEGIPYPLFTFVGILPWTLFAGCLRSASQSVLHERAILAKVYVPRLVIPISAMAPNFVNFLASSVLLVGLLVIYRVVPDWRVITLPLFLLLGVLTALGVGLSLSGLSVKYRDVVIGLGFMIQAWQYLTPVAYSASLIPESAAWLYRLNPMTTVVLGFRWAILGLAGPSPALVVGQFVVVSLFAVVGLIVFGRSIRTIVDVF
jgi:lipopolysaccharide transport system permease protein